MKLSLVSSLFSVKRLAGGAGPHWEEGTKVYGPLDATAERWRHAADIVDRRDGYAMKLKRYWQGTAIALGVASVAFAGGWYQQAQRSSVQVVVVPVDRLGDPAEVYIPGEFTPTAAMIDAAAARFIQIAFTKSSDPNINKANALELRNRVRGDAIERWNAWWRETNTAATERLIRVQTIKHTASPNVVTVIWLEQDWRNGRSAPWRRMNGDFTFELRKPGNRADVLQNPLGLFVTHMDFAAEDQMPQQAAPVGAEQ